MDSGILKYKCNICKLAYETYNGMWKHNKKYHTKKSNIAKPAEIIPPQNTQHQNSPSKIPQNTPQFNISNEFICNYCDKKLSRSDNLKRHLKICDKKEKKDEENNEIKKELALVKDKLEKLETKPNTTNTNSNNNINNINNGTINKGPVYNFFTPSGKENIMLLSENEIQYIIDQEMNCIVSLVEMLNFNEKHPENHTFCTTALNDKYISTMNSETQMIEKQRKKDFFDKILIEGIKKMKLLYSKLTSKNSKKAVEYKNNIEKLIEFVIMNNKGKKAYIELMNTLTFNKRHITQSTWFQLKDNPDKLANKKIESENEDEKTEDFKEIFLVEEIKPKPLKKQFILQRKSSDTEDSESDNSSESESDDSSDMEENELPEIKIKNTSYLLDGIYLYNIVDGKKGELAGNFINGKIKKI